AEYPFAINPLDIPKTDIIRAIGLLEYFFSSLLTAELTSLQKTLFRNIFPFLVTCVPNPTLDDFRNIIQNGLANYRGYLDKAPPPVREFLTNEFEKPTYRDTKEQLLWRLSYLMTNPFLDAMFSSKKTKFDLGKAMDEGKIIVINNSVDLL